MITPRNLFNTLLSLAVLVLSSCAGVQTSNAPAGGDAPLAGMGLVTFYREKSFVGAAISYKIKEGDTQIGGLKNGSYFVHQAAPGTHTYTAKTEVTKMQVITVEAGKRYYVRGGVQMGLLAGHPTLLLVDPSAATPQLPNLKRVVIK